jgi:hypothetical protein
MANPVFSILDDLAKNVGDLRQALSPLLSLASSPVSRRGRARKRRGRRPGRPAGNPSQGARRAPKPARVTRRKFSPKGRAALKLAGRYMGLTRPLSASDKAKVKAVRERIGIQAAIKAAEKLRKK